MYPSGTRLVAAKSAKRTEANPHSLSGENLAHSPFASDKI
jgi:hypothetical protein